MARGACPSLFGTATYHLGDHKPFAKITLNSIVYSFVHQLTCIVYHWKGNYMGVLSYKKQRKYDINYLYKKRYTAFSLRLPPTRLQRGLQ